MIILNYGDPPPNFESAMSPDKKVRIALLALTVGLPMAGIVLTAVGLPMDGIGGGVH